MKKTLLTVLTFLTIFVTYFYIPFGDINKSAIQTAAAADDGYFYASTCATKDKNVLSLAPDTVLDEATTFGQTKIVFRHFKVKDAGKNIEISLTLGASTIKKTYAYTSNTYTGSTDLAIWKDTSTSIQTNYVAIETTKLDADSATAKVYITDKKDIPKSLMNTASSTNIYGEYGKFIYLFNQKSNTINEDECRIFNPNQNLNIQVRSSGADLPPILSLVGAAGYGRPAMDFNLKMVLPVKSGFAPNNNFFIFAYNGTDEKFKNIGIRLEPTSNGYAVSFGDIARYNDDSDYEVSDLRPGGMSGFPRYFLSSFTGIKIEGNDKKLLYDLLWNKVYNTWEQELPVVCGATVGTLPTQLHESNWNWQDDTPALKCLNVSPDGYLYKWEHVDHLMTTSDPVSLTSPGTSDTTVTDAECPFNALQKINEPIRYIGCQIAKWFRDVASSMMCFAQIKLFDSLGMLDVSTMSTSTCTSGDANEIKNNFDRASTGTSNSNTSTTPTTETGTTTTGAGSTP